MNPTRAQVDEALRVVAEVSWPSERERILALEVRRLRASLEAVEWITRRMLASVPDAKLMQAEHAQYKATIERVEALPAKWRAEDYDEVECADDLEAELRDPP